MTKEPQVRHFGLVVAAAVIGLIAAYRFPFPEYNAVLGLIEIERPWLFTTVKCAYNAMLFTTPWIAVSMVSSLAYIFLDLTIRKPALAALPPYPEVATREDLFLVLGEQHHSRKPVPSDNPHWLTIPSRGLYTGIAVFGAIGSAKTSGCMLPFAEQILGFQAGDHDKKIGGLVLEVKGDFCDKIRGVLERYGRGGDYVEVNLNGSFQYNPLHNDLDAYALAFGIASVLNNLYGRSNEPFWQQAYTNLIKFIILLHKVLYDYVTLFDVYECAINPDLIELKIQEAERRYERRSILISVSDFVSDAGLESFPFERIDGTPNMKTVFTKELEGYLEGKAIAFETKLEPGTPGGGPIEAEDHKRDQFEAVKRWFYHDWKRIEPRLRTSIVEGISVFLSLFDDNPTVKRVFCPPKEAYDPVTNAQRQLGQVLPTFGDMIERGTVCALNFPAATNPGLARVVGTLMKQDFQRAVINRIPKISREPNRHFRPVLFLCDEYQAFATAGEHDPSGDEKFFALSRQAKCIPIVATQSISSLRSTLAGETWRTLLQTFRTKVFLTLSDDFSAQIASQLCGKEEQLKLSYSISENGQDAGVSMLTGTASAHRATLSTSKSYTVHRDFTFEPKIFSELKNGQAIALAYDGFNPHPPSYVYLKPAHLDRSKSYWQQLQEGLL